MKNLYSEETAVVIARAMRGAWKPFPEKKFLRGIGAELAPLELKARMALLADRLEASLPDKVPELFRILTDSLPAVGSEPMGWRGFLVWPLTEIVSRRGLPYFEESMTALREMTIRFTSEFAIRRFLREDPERVLARFHEWCADPNEHVRRFVSEGTRPYLPWGGNLPEFARAPYPTLPLLEKIHADESDYVRLSVANHLNDLSKQSPEVVLETLARWGMASTHAQRLARHACRTLLKNGHTGALRLHGYGATRWEVAEFSLSSATVPLGGALAFSFVVRNPGKKPTALMFDYAVHYRKADGSLRAKVFKGATRQLAAGESRKIEARHVFREMTTRKHHPGGHKIELLLNGVSSGTLEFMLFQTRESSAGIGPCEAWRQQS